MKKILSILGASAIMIPNFSLAQSADIGQASSDFVQASGVLAKTLSVASAQFSGETLNVSMNASHASMMLSKKISVKGWKLSKDSATMVLSWIDNPGENVEQLVFLADALPLSIVAASGTSAIPLALGLDISLASTYLYRQTEVRKVFTAAGQAFETSLAISKDVPSELIVVSQEIIEGTNDLTIKVYNSTKTAVIGSVRVSKAVATEIMTESSRAGDSLVDSGKYLLEKSGHLIRVSAKGAVQILGQVVDQSENAVEFVENEAGQLLSLSKTASAVAIKSSSELFKSIVVTTWAAANLTSYKSQKGAEASQQSNLRLEEKLETASAQSQEAISTGAKISVKGSFMILEAGGKTVRLLIRSLNDLYYSEKVEDKK